eukprot:14460-Hanusia_phi.AAC.5
MPNIHTYHPSNITIPPFIVNQPAQSLQQPLMLTNNPYLTRDDGLMLNNLNSLLPFEEQAIVIGIIKKPVNNIVFNQSVEELDALTTSFDDNQRVFICDMLSTPRIKVFHVRNNLVKIYLDLDDYYQELDFQNSLIMAVTEENARQIKCWSYSGITSNCDNRDQLAGYSVTEVEGEMLAMTHFDERNFPFFKDSIHTLMRQMTLIHCRGLFHLRINRYNLFFSRTYGVMLTDFSCINLGYNGKNDNIFYEKQVKFEACDKYLLCTAFILSIPPCILHGKTEEQDETHMAHIISNFIKDCYSFNENINNALDAVLSYTNTNIYNKVINDMHTVNIRFSGHKRNLSDMIGAR